MTDHYTAISGLEARVEALEKYLAAEIWKSVPDPAPRPKRRWYRCNDCGRTFDRIYGGEGDLHWGPTSRCDPVGDYRWVEVEEVKP